MTGACWRATGARRAGAQVAAATAGSGAGASGSSGAAGSQGRAGSEAAGGAPGRRVRREPRTWTGPPAAVQDRPEVRRDRYRWYRPDRRRDGGARRRCSESERRAVCRGSRVRLQLLRRRTLLRRGLHWRLRGVRHRGGAGALPGGHFGPAAWRARRLHGHRELHGLLHRRVRTACTFPASTTACRTQGCSGNMLAPDAFCDGAGACAASAAHACAGGLVCNDAGTACLAACRTDADCLPPTPYCSAKACTAVRPDGVACSSDGQCQSGRVRRYDLLRPGVHGFLSGLRRCWARRDLLAYPGAESPHAGRGACPGAAPAPVSVTAAPPSASSRAPRPLALARS